MQSPPIRASILAVLPFGLTIMCALGIAFGLEAMKQTTDQGATGLVSLAIAQKGFDGVWADLFVVTDNHGPAPNSGPTDAKLAPDTEQGFAGGFVEASNGPEVGPPALTGHSPSQPLLGGAPRELRPQTTQAIAPIQ